MTFTEYIYELYVLECRKNCLDPIDEEKYTEMFKPVEIESQKTDKVEK